MATERSILTTAPPAGLKLVPPEADLRARLRQTSEVEAAALDRASPPGRDLLEITGERVLRRLALPRAYLGFAMIAVSNAFWRAQFEAVPPHRRLLLLPHCLRDRQACRGKYDSTGLHCAACGACDLAGLHAEAEALGYRVVIAGGTSAVLLQALEGEADALLGVACLDSLEHSYERLAELGIPHLALPLLRDGCADTELEPEVLREYLAAQRPPAPGLTRTYLPLLREAARALGPEALPGLLAPYLPAEELSAEAADPFLRTGALAVDWLRRGGKRLRPFVTLAAYAVARHGTAALSPQASAAELIPDSVRRLAVAIEALHKASLVHDDLEDDDAYRYGEPTLHRSHGPAVALNVGDLLLGLGYRLVAGEVDTLGAECIADLLGSLSQAHLELCRGQGAELTWPVTGGELTPRDALLIGARKTAPAFEVALYTGLRAAQVELDPVLLRQFCAYLGEAYQVGNDLEDWEEPAGNQREVAADVATRRPTMLRALVLQAGGGPRLIALEGADLPPEALAESVRALYAELGVFGQAEALVRRLRERALDLTAEVQPPALAELLRFLVRVILPPRPAPSLASRG